MSLYQEIQSDILGSVPISTILRKAKVLGYHLKSQELKDWVEYELNGYVGKEGSLPDYRRFNSPSYGNFANLVRRKNRAPIFLNNFPEKFRISVSSVEISQGVTELESVIRIADAHKTEELKYPWPPELIPYLSGTVYEKMECLDAWRVVTRSHIAQILDTVRNRLLSFILEIAEQYPEAIESDFKSLSPIPGDKIQAIFNYYIMGDNPNVVGVQEGTMSVFDQRNQNVQYQYNAAGNINFDNVSNRVEFASELEKLRQEIKRASTVQALDEDTATDVENRLTQAIQQSQKTEPDQRVILEHIHGAKTLIEGIASAAGLVAALIKAAELAQRFF